jgi:hypothetical protein
MQAVQVLPSGSGRDLAGAGGELYDVVVVFEGKYQKPSRRARGILKLIVDWTRSEQESII